MQSPIPAGLVPWLHAATARSAAARSNPISCIIAGESARFHLWISSTRIECTKCTKQSTMTTPSPKHAAIGMAAQAGVQANTRTKSSASKPVGAALAAGCCGGWADGGAAPRTVVLAAPSGAASDCPTDVSRWSKLSRMYLKPFQAPPKPTR